MKRLLSIVILIVFLVVPFASNAMAEPAQVGLPQVLYSNWNASQAYGKAAIRIFGLIVAGLVISGLKALGRQIKSNSEERETKPVQDVGTNENIPDQPQNDNATLSQAGVDSSTVAEDSFDEQMNCAPMETTCSQETTEFYLGQNTSCDADKADEAPKFCRKCGKRLFPDSIFCDNCGTKIK